MKTIIKYLVVSVIIAILAIVVYLKVYVPKHTFKVIQPTAGQLQVTVKGIGNVSALNIYSITAQTGGKILKILTDEGRWVKKGELLIVMDGVDLPRQLEIAKINYIKAEYEVKTLQGELKSQKTQEALLQVTYSRYKKLNEQRFVAQAEYDKVLADLQGIQAAITASASRIASSQSAVKVAAKNIDVLQEKIDRLKVYAPGDGYVLVKEAEIMQYVQPSTPVLKIVDPKTLWVETKIDERISAQIKLSQTATIILRSRPDKHYKGVVRRIGTMTDAVTLERKIDVAFETIPTPFFINEQAQVIIDIKRYGNVTKVPLMAVVQKEGKPGMWVVREDRAHFTVINKIARNETEMAIAEADKNSFIIVPDRHKKSLSEGMRIYQ
ncbi:MAG: efflux RND transporter periplasmic adaptor subunit [Deltaproteobacteria bacterium]|nr:MAG: efflux RND transporter periplasmic adaptor subunit [Deltaproteobacteria bacterium]